MGIGSAQGGRGTGDITGLIDSLAQALVLADVVEAESLSAVERAAKALASAGRRAKAPWAEDAAAIVADAGLLATDPNPRKLLEDLAERLGALQAVAASQAGSAAPAPTRAARPEPDRKAAWPGPDTTPIAADKDLLRDFVTRAGEHLEAADEGLLALERQPSDAEALDSVFRAFHTIKGMAGFMALADIERLAHDAESALDGPRSGAAQLDTADFDTVFRSVDAMKKLVADILPSSQRPRGTIPPSSPSAPSPPSPAATSSATPGESVRIDEERLDRLLETIGELVIAESVLADAARCEAAMVRFAPQLARLDKITRELQEMSTSLRMVPLHSTFVRMARVVRDTARRADKTVRFVTAGGETELDKLVVDRIADPLIHLLRNAVDHGVESAGARAAAGKPSAGRVEIRAFHSGGRIHIEVSDDGGGLDLAAITDAARRRGLLAADESPDERRLVDLVFAPGLSTADEVTDVSGRGVGMDVVRKTIEELRGDIDVWSEPGRGTRVSIRLPLTLAIIDGMVVRVGAERYIVPTVSVVRSLQPEAEQLTSVMGAGQILKVGEALVPLIQLAGLFQVDAAERNPTHGIVVVVSANGEQAGIVADEILGQQQTVIKPLGDGLDGIAGVAIMPDGQVGLILDVGGLVQLAREQEV